MSITTFEFNAVASPQSAVFLEIKFIRYCAFQTCVRKIATANI